MSIDLNASGAKVIGGSGGGTSGADPLIQTVQVSQTNIGNVPVTEANLESAIGTNADATWTGSGIASAIAALKSIAIRNGVGASVQSGSGTISVGSSAQNLFAGQIPVNGYLVQNNSSGLLYINDLGTASASGTSIQLAANGGTFITPPGYGPPGVVSIFGATSGQAFAARRW